MEFSTKAKVYVLMKFIFFLKFASNQLNSKLVTIPSKYFVNQFYNVYKHLISPLKKWGSLEKKKSEAVQSISSLV